MKRLAKPVYFPEVSPGQPWPEMAVWFPPRTQWGMFDWCFTIALILLTIILMVLVWVW